jgi:site-specific recombinase XerD
LAALEEVVPLYLKACEVEGKTDRTVQCYGETLRHFKTAVTVLGLPEAVEAFLPAHVYLFLGWVKDRGVSAGTQHRRQREVKAFFSWCRRMDYIKDNPFMRVPMVRREQKVVQPFSQADIMQLLEGCDAQTYVGCRMRAMIFFLLDTGVRSSELVSIRLDDIFFEQHRVRVLQGKGKKQRWTAISDIALEGLNEYLDRFRGRVDGHLFQTVDVRPLKNHHMNLMFTRHAFLAGVSHVNPHRFRHTFATWAIRANARELDVQYLLGHSSPMMVRRYSATYDSEQAAANHAAFSPAAQLLRSPEGTNVRSQTGGSAGTLA